MYHGHDDKSLMAMVCAGEHDAFAEIVSRHTDRYYALAFRTLQNASDAEDAVQNAFIKLWKKPFRWDASKSQFTTWFYRVVINECHDHIRKQKKSVNADHDVIDSLVEPVIGEECSLEQSQISKMQQQALALAIKALPSSQRDALNLFVYIGLSQKEVAKIMDTSIKSVESLLVRARRSIAASIKKQPLSIQNDAIELMALKRKGES